jgi:uncharacterized protein
MRRIFPALATLLFWSLAAAQIAVPPLKARVTDLTATLSVEQQQALEQTLAEFEGRKGSQIALLMVPSTQPETVEQYGVRVEEAWKLGRKGVDDGVLLLVAKDDRKLRIEVGYGLEGVLPDATAKRIIEEDITPRFKQGDYYGGVRAGTDRIMKVIEGEPLPSPRARSSVQPQLDFVWWIVIGLVVVSIAQAILHALFGRFIGSGLAGAAAGLLVWLVVGWVVAAAAAGLVVFLLSVFVPPSSAMRGGGGRSGSSGGGWSSGGGGGGGFSGGGGSSGGGGASGSW